MNVPNYPRRFHAGGFTGGPLKPGEIPVLLLPGYLLTRPEAVAPKATPIDARCDFTATFDAVDPAFEALLRRVVKNVAAESTARLITVSLIREFGVGLPLKAFRNLPRPLDQMQALVLAKLEAIAEHVGTP